MSPKEVIIGQMLRDTWYGSCTVIAKGKTYIGVRMHCPDAIAKYGNIWTYDLSHAKKFLVRT